MKIRGYRTGDSVAMADLFHRAVRDLGGRDYSQAQVEAWAGPRVTAERLDKMYTDGRDTFIAVDEADRPIAFSDLEASGHVDMLYCDPAHAGKGVASSLLAAIEEKARTAGIGRLYTEASETARPVFERAGYRVLGRQDLKIGAVAIHNWKMEKAL